MVVVVYKVTGAKKDRLVHMARTIDQPGWWETSSDGIPGQLTALCAFEKEATKIAEVELMVIPGLLQTERYARAQLQTGKVLTPEVLADRLSIRLGRQRVLARRNPPAFEAIIDEIAMCRAMCDPDVMAEQLRYLVRMAAQPHVTIRVLRNPRHPGTAGPYITLEFPSPAQPFVHIEHFKSSLFLDEPEDVREYQALTASLAEMALAPRESQEFMAYLARRYEDEAKGQGYRPCTSERGASPATATTRPPASK